MALDGQVNFIRMELKLGTTMLALARTERQMWELEALQKQLRMPGKHWTAPSDPYLN
jgi:hypothetical protein